MRVKRIAIDGKFLRRSHDSSIARKMLHCNRVWSVWDALELDGASVTIDAMGCQKEIAAKIADGGRHFVLGAKVKLPTLCDAIAAYFNAEHGEGQ